MKKRMKKGKITMIITIGISCFALVLVMFMLWPLIPNVSGIRFSLASMIVCYFIPNLAENNIKYTIHS